APPVGGLPAGGQADREAEVRVPKGLALEDTVARGGADREAVEMREEVGVRGGDRRGGGARQVRRLPRRRRHPLRCRRMRGEEAPGPRLVVMERLLALERVQEGREGGRIIPRAGDDLLPDAVRLALLVPAVGGKERGVGELSDAAEQPADCGADEAGDPGAERGPQCERSGPR